MPVNTWNTNLRVETQTPYGPMDNEEFLELKNHAEHSEPDNPEPWSQSYRAKEQAAQAFVEANNHPVEVDPSLQKAHQDDLKIRNLDR